MFSVVTDSQFQLPQIFISQIDRGSIALSLRWVSVKRGVAIGVSAGFGFYFFSKECCFRVKVMVSVKPNPNLSPKTAFYKKKNQRKTIVNSLVRCLENKQLVITSGFPTANFRK